MFQDINPYQICNDFISKKPTGKDIIVLFNNNSVLLEEKNDNLVIPNYNTIKKFYPKALEELTYVFSIGDISFFLSFYEVSETTNFSYHGIQTFRDLEPSWVGFAGATAYHLAYWYSAHRYCGRCSAGMAHKEHERALYCPECGMLEYPKIAPVVIVGITSGEKLLLTKYSAGNYKKYALVAGFVEIGETLEDTVKRETLEEVGLRLKNIKYYKSQPWAFSQSLLIGFFAELDGNSKVTLDDGELSEAIWLNREDIPEDDTSFSLTWDMIEAFKNNKI